MINKIKQTWTYNHKLLIVTISLAVAHIAPLVPLPDIQAYNTPVTYIATTTAIYSLESEIENRTIELYNQGKDMDMERYRQQAIADINIQLQGIVYKSPYVNYDELKDKYGY